jgi:hypothetical protein
MKCSGTFPVHCVSQTLLQVYERGVDIGVGDRHDELTLSKKRTNYGRLILWWLNMRGWLVSIRYSMQTLFWI